MSYGFPFAPFITRNAGIGSLRALGHPHPRHGQLWRLLPSGQEQADLLHLRAVSVSRAVLGKPHVDSTVWATQQGASGEAVWTTQQGASGEAVWR
jgi:hypothetical protein